MLKMDTILGPQNQCVVIPQGGGDQYDYRQGYKTITGIFNQSLNLQDHGQ